MKNIKNTIKNTIKQRFSIVLVGLLIVTTSCNNYLDIVPDNVATIDNAFALRNEAEKYLFTCYSFLPKNGDGWYNVGLHGADEIFLPLSSSQDIHAAFQIALGEQNANAPLFDEWAGLRKGRGNGWAHLKMWRGIRQCNVFIENMENPDKVPDITDFERNRWIAEATFLKAYYHFYLFRMYGPIPIMDKVEPILPEPTAKRAPVDEVVNYISRTLDSASVNLPQSILDKNNELGRATKPIAKAIKAKLWITAASPLFNGNPDYAGFVDNDGVNLFPTEYDPTKWEKARDAAKAAIESAEMNGASLYEYTNDTRGLTDTIETQLSIRNAVTERWNDEQVWALSNSEFINQNLCMPPTVRGEIVDRFILNGIWSAPIKIAKMFYTKNGVPIEEDKTLDFSNYMAVRKATSEERYYVETGYETARLNYDREPRFYADLGFDGGIWYMQDGNQSGGDENTFYLRAKGNEIAGFGSNFNYWNQTGYFIKKLVNWESSTNSTNVTWQTYPWPEIRLADLYLIYAEALNEVEPASLEAIEYLNRIRERAGLSGVIQSWSLYSSNPAKFTTQDGLREIIHQERMIELAFEGHRFWDLRRWKKAAQELNEDITGFSIRNESTEAYNKELFVYQQRFIAPRDYLWPIGIEELRKNPNLVQNPGW